METVSLDAESLAERLPTLLLDANRVAAAIAQGVHNRRRAGPGDGFWQYRRYQPGDAATAIDWRQSAKSDPLFVRETEWAAAQTVWLWSDSSASMRWRSTTALPDKEQRAALLLLALSIGLVGAGERVGLLDDDGPATADLMTPRRLAARLREPRLPRFRPVQRHSQVVLFSDFLMPLPEIDSLVKSLANQGATGHLVQILDPAEETLPFTGRVLFEGLEEDGEMLANHAESLRDDYRQAMLAHRAGLATIARAVDWRLTLHHSDAAPTLPLLALHQALSGQG